MNSTDPSPNPQPQIPRLGGIGSMMVDGTVAPFNPQPQIPWGEDAGPELDKVIERLWRAQERGWLGGIGSMMVDSTVVPGVPLGGIGSMMVDAMVMLRVRRRRGAKPRLSPEFIEQAKEDLRASGNALRPYALAWKHIINFSKRKGLTLDKRQFKTAIRWIIIPLLPEDQKPKKRQPRKSKGNLE